MATLTTKQRKAMPRSAFAGPGKSYPVKDTGSVKSDRAHAGNAKARATQEVKAGKLSPSAASKIKAAANKVLKGKK